MILAVIDVSGGPEEASHADQAADDLDDQVEQAWVGGHHQGADTDQQEADDDGQDSSPEV